MESDSPVAPARALGFARADARLGADVVGGRRPAADRWRADIESWRIPDEILAAAPESPWALPVPRFSDRTRRQLDEPSGRSYAIALEALPAGGSVLDVGAGAGAASLALRRVAGSIIAVDESAAMLRAVAELAASTDLTVTTVAGPWPDVAAAVPVVEVVVCHHVLYNVAVLDPFVAALTAHARRRVVVEITAQHPMALYNPLWQALHGIDRPTGPTAADAVAVIAATGVEPRFEAWSRPISRQGTGYAELVASTGRRLCLGSERFADVEAALGELGVGPERPYLGGPTRDVVTIWWDR